VQLGDSGKLEEVLSGLTFATAMTSGPDGALYVSEFGYGDPGFGRILKVMLKWSGSPSLRTNCIRQKRLQGPDAV